MRVFLRRLKSTRMLACEESFYRPDFPATPRCPTSQPMPVSVHLIVQRVRVTPAIVDVAAVRLFVMAVAGWWADQAAGEMASDAEPASPVWTISAAGSSGGCPRQKYAVWL